MTLSPEDVFLEYVWAILLDDFERMAAQIAPRELELFRDQVVEGLGVATGAQLGRHLKHGFGDDVSLDDLQTMPPSDVFVKFLSTRAKVSGGGGTTRASGPPEIVTCDVHEDLATVEWRSKLSSGDDTMVLERRTGMRHHDGRWWVLLDERLANVGASIRKQLEDEAGE